MKTKNLKPNRNNIDTYLPVFHGFYGSFWDDPSFDGEAEHFNLPEDFPFRDFFDWKAYKEDLSKQFCNIIENEMSDFVERIDYENLYSPQYYNFSNDSINCIIRPKKKEVQKYIYEHKEQFTKYLRDHLTSRDGFISWHSNQFDEWEEMTHKFTRWDKDVDSKGFNLGFVLAFIAEEEKITEEVFYYNAEDSVSNFYTKEFDKIINLLEGVKESEVINVFAVEQAISRDYNDIPKLNQQVEEISEFVKENYIKPNVVTMTISKFEEIIEEGYIKVEELIDRVINEIESQTLKLDLK